MQHKRTGRLNFEVKESMNHTIKAIIIVVAIASMLVVEATTVPIMQNSFASKRSDFKGAEGNPNTNTNTNTNSADSSSTSTATADNTNNITNSASSNQAQSQSACAVAVTCPEGSTTITTLSSPSLSSPSPSPATTLQISKHCDPSCSSNLMFPIVVAGNNPEPSSFRLRNGESQSVTLGPGGFTVIETLPIDFRISFSGDCRQGGPTIGAGQNLHCTITNTHPYLRNTSQMGILR